MFQIANAHTSNTKHRSVPHPTHENTHVKTHKHTHQRLTKSEWCTDHGARSRDLDPRHCGQGTRLHRKICFVHPEKKEGTPFFLLDSGFGTEKKRVGSGWGSRVQRGSVPHHSPPVRSQCREWHRRRKRGMPLHPLRSPRLRMCRSMLRCRPTWRVSFRDWD